MNMDMASYKSRVWLLAAQREGEAVYNGSPEHATIIVERLFASAHEHVRLLTGDLEAKVYADPSVVESAQRFLGHVDHRLDVLVEDDNFSQAHLLWKSIGDSPNAHFFKVPAELSERIPYHFMTADSDCFRFERNKNSHTAVAAFGDQAATTNLNGIFDSLKARCEEFGNAPA